MLYILSDETKNHATAPETSKSNDKNNMNFEVLLFKHDEQLTGCKASATGSSFEINRARDKISHNMNVKK